MDPLSVAASVVGLIAAGGKVAVLLYKVVDKYKDSEALAQSILQEVEGVSTTLGHLQPFLRGGAEAAPERGNLILLDQVLTTLTGCVTTYSEIQFILAGLNISENTGTFNRIKWMSQESRLNTLVQRLQSHKLSITLMLTIIQCKSMQEAQGCTQKLRVLVEQILESNRDLAERIGGLEREGSIISRARSAMVPEDNASTIHQVSSTRGSNLELGDMLAKRFAFEHDLESSRAYAKAVYRHSQLSVTSTALYTTALSVFSKLSLSQVSSISFYALPIYPVDLHNSELYVFGEEGAVVIDPHVTSPVAPKTSARPASRPSEISVNYKPTHKYASPETEKLGELQASRKPRGLLGRFASPRRTFLASRPRIQQGGYNDVPRVNTISTFDSPFILTSY
ncbi:hypothetical protein ANO14919_135870 [Xylariales sp. No.14919]|nr:hypothetical protein ANO14919_135870 [Xylariales sp. No.14919]